MTKLHLISLGNTMGGFARFRSTSSIKATFHFSRLICHIPRKAVKMGTKMRKMVVGRRKAEDEDEDEDEDKDEDGREGFGKGLIGRMMVNVNVGLCEGGSRCIERIQGDVA